MMNTRQMPSLHPREAKHDGADVVILPKEEFIRLREMAEDYQDLLDLEAAKALNADDPGISLEEAKKRYGMK
jgi:hypothetical protein